MLIWRFVVIALTCVLTGGPGFAGETEQSPVTALNKLLEEYVQQRAAEFDEIPGERQSVLLELADFIGGRRAAGQPVRLIFICTHNSRRSHLAQIWAAAAAAHYGVAGIETYSGGTEATAFNPRAVAALERAGFELARDDANADNPRYRVRYSKAAKPLVCFSKEFGQPPNPRDDFCAVMTCSQADEACPAVAGAAKRIALPYEDPKAADGAPGETATYDERCAQIGRELLFVFARVAESSRSPGER
jgi:hypothetical protein